MGPHLFFGSHRFQGVSVPQKGLCPGDAGISRPYSSPSKKHRRRLRSTHGHGSFLPSLPVPDALGDHPFSRGSLSGRDSVEDHRRGAVPDADHALRAYSSTPPGKGGFWNRSCSWRAYKIPEPPLRHGPSPRGRGMPRPLAPPSLAPVEGDGASRPVAGPEPLRGATPPVDRRGLCKLAFGG